MNPVENSPLVSVVMGTFNEPPLIVEKSIESILNQTFTDFELIILDDSTHEETKERINSFSADARVRILRENQRMGFVKSLNRGLSQARGRYIARMDGDDICVLNRLELQVKYLEENPLVSVVGGAFYTIDEADHILSKRKYPVSRISFMLLALYRDPLAHPTVMMRKTCVEDGFFYDESFHKAEDLELWLRLLKNGFRLANMNDFLLYYRIDGDLSKKRSKIHWSYNLKARVKNMSFKMPIFSILSILISFAYTVTPDRIVRVIYHLENKTKKK